jgi:ferredoxin
VNAITSWFGRRIGRGGVEQSWTTSRHHRAFPTDGYLTRHELGETHARRHSELESAALAADREVRSSRASSADRRVIRGPTQADRDHLPYIQEAWQWAYQTVRSLGLKPKRKPFGCALDLLTRMRLAALVEQRNLVWPETAAKVAGLDPARIEVEHDVRPEDVDPILSQADGLLGQGIEAGWNGIVWGDIDPDDPLRTLEIDRETCEACGRCVVLCPEAFAKSPDGDVYVTLPTAVRERELQTRCMEAVEKCARGALRLNSRGGRTLSGVMPPRGRPLPGELQDRV